MTTAAMWPGFSLGDICADETAWGHAGSEQTGIPETDCRVIAGDTVMEPGDHLRPHHDAVARTIAVPGLVPARYMPCRKRRVIMVRPCSSKSRSPIPDAVCPGDGAEPLPHRLDREQFGVLALDRPAEPGHEGTLALGVPGELLVLKPDQVADPGTVLAASEVN